MVSIHYPSGLQKKKCSLCGKEFYRCLGNDYAYKTVKRMKTLYFLQLELFEKSTNKRGG